MKKNKGEEKKNEHQQRSIKIVERWRKNVSNSFVCHILDKLTNFTILIRSSAIFAHDNTPHMHTNNA